MRAIPFRREFAAAINEGRKTCTARNEQYGEPGDLLVASTGAMLELVEVEKVRLGTVRDHYWRDEGVESPEDFERIWNVIHPRKRFDSAQMVWLHRFRLASGSGTGEKP